MLSFALAAFELDLRTGELRKSGVKIHLPISRFRFSGHCWIVQAISSPARS